MFTFVRMIYSCCDVENKKREIEMVEYIISSPSSGQAKMLLFVTKFDLSGETKHQFQVPYLKCIY